LKLERVLPCDSEANECSRCLNLTLWIPVSTNRFLRCHEYLIPWLVCNMPWRKPCTNQTTYWARIH
jgi:hypothetical protein